MVYPSLILLCLAVSFVRSQSDLDNDCPFHLCTPERLGCPSSRLLTNDKGCMLCKCEESVVPSRRCHLHGCTVELLECKSSKLKQSPEGCTLCECEDLVASTTVRLDVGTASSIDPETGSPVNSQLPIAPEIGRKDELGLNSHSGVDDDSAATATVTCKPVDCTPESLGCEMLAINPMTGCTTCACAENPSISGLYLRSIDDDLSSISVGEPEIENPCPDPRELLQTEGSHLGENLIGKAARYKLNIGKLKKGFQPGETYKIQLHKHDDAEPFRAFLFDIKPAPQPAGKNRGRAVAASSESDGNETSDSNEEDGTCGAGYLIDTGNGTNSVRSIPHCRSSALEGDGLSNKTEVAVEWVAPSCGCVHIRAAVVDHTDKVVYMDPTLSTENPLEKPKSKKAQSKRPLFLTVCAKSPGGRRGKPDKSQKGNLPSWIVSDCCLAGIPKSKKMNRKAHKAEICERDSILYSTAEYFSYRFSVIRKTCRKAYKKCCVMAQEFDIGNGNKGGKSEKTNLLQQKPNSSQTALSMAVGDLPSSPNEKSSAKKNKKNKNKKRRKKKGKANKGKGKNKKSKKGDRKKRIKKRKTQKVEKQKSS